MPSPLGKAGIGTRFLWLKVVGSPICSRDSALDAIAKLDSSHPIGSKNWSSHSHQTIHSSRHNGLVKQPRN